MPVVKKVSEQEALAPRKRGRPKGSKNAPKTTVTTPVKTTKKRGRPSAADASPKFVYTSKVCNCKIVTGIKMLEVYCEHRNRMTLKV